MGEHGQLADLITDDLLEDLGPINLAWFDELSATANIKSKSNDQAESDDVQIDIDGAKQDAPTESPHMSSLSIPNISSPSLFSLENVNENNQGIRQSLVQQYVLRRGGRLMNVESPLFHSNDVLVTPTTVRSEGLKHQNWASLSCPTPNLFATQSTTKQLLGTPSTPSARMVRSLGIDINDSAMSWSSSLATPPNTAPPENVETISPRKSKEEYASIGAARMLFSPDNLANNTQDTIGFEVMMNTTIEEASFTECCDQDYNKTKPDTSHQPDIITMVTNPQAQQTSKNSDLEASNIPTNLGPQLSNYRRVVEDLTKKPSKSLSKKEVSCEESMSKIKDRTEMNTEEAKAEPPSPDVMDDILSVFFSSPPRTRRYIRNARKRALKKELSSSPVSRGKKRLYQDSLDISINTDVLNSKSVAINKDTSEETNLLKTPLTVKNTSITTDVCSVTKMANDSAVASPGPGLFSQISPSSLNAMCQAAETTDTSGVYSSSGTCTSQKVTTANDSTLRLMADRTPRADQTPMADKTPKNTTAILSHLETKTPQTQSLSGMVNITKLDSSRKNPPQSTTPILEKSSCEEDMFSQISPSALDSIFKATATSTPLIVKWPDSGNLSEANLTGSHQNEMPATPVRWKSSYKQEEKTRDLKKVFTSELKQSSVSCISEKVPNVPVLSATAGKIGRKHKSTKRFSYPTSSQVAEVCPKKIFNFDVDQKWKTLELNQEKGADDNTDVIVEALNHVTSLVPNLANKNVKESNHIPTERGDGPSHEDNHASHTEKVRKIAKPYRSRINQGFVTLNAYNSKMSGGDSAVSNRLLPDKEIPNSDNFLVKRQDFPKPEKPSGEDPQETQTISRKYCSYIEQEYSLTDKRKGKQVAPRIIPEQAGSLHNDRKEDSHVQLTKYHTSKSHEAKTRDSISEGFIGFKAASGKHISVSDSSLELAAAISRQIDMDIHRTGEEDVTTAAQNNGGFKAGCGKPTTLSEASLRKAAKTSRCTDIGLIKTKDYSDFAQVSCFMAANGEPDSASLEEATLTKKNEKDIINKNNLDASSSTLCGFKSASGKALMVSSAAMSKAVEISKEIDKNMEQASLIRNQPNAIQSHPCNSVLVGSNSIPEQETDQNGRSCQDVKKQDDCIDIKKKYTEKADCGVNSSGSKSVPLESVSGFQSASGKTFNLNPRSLKIAATIASEIDQDLKAECGNYESLGNKGKESIDFQTARVNTLEVSKTAWKKATSIAKGLENELGNDISQHKNYPLTDSSKMATKDKTDLPSTDLPVMKSVKDTLKAKDYSKMPKGFRPFKPPRLNNIEQCPKPPVLIKDPQDHQKQTDFKDNGESVVAVNKCNSMQKTEIEILKDEKSETKEGLSCTQMNEVSETLAFLQNDEKFSQVAFTQAQSNSQNDDHSEGGSVEILPIISRHINGTSTVEKNNVPMSGFQTASGQSITISETALSHAKTMLNEELKESKRDHSENDIFSLPGKASDTLTHSDGMLSCAGSWVNQPGFQTASGRFISASENSLSHARNLLVEETPVVGEDYSKKWDKQIKDKGPGKWTDQTVPVSVTGPCDKISMDSLQPGDYVSSTENKELVSLESSIKKQNHAELLGFSTAAGNVLAVSTSSLVRAKILLEEDDKSYNSIQPEVDAQAVPSSPGLIKPIGDQTGHLGMAAITSSLPGFQIAGVGNNLVSESSLHHAKGLSSDEGLDQASSISSDPSPLPGQRAKVNVDRPVSKPVSTVLRDKDKFAGFSTASGHMVNISESALQQARMVLHGDDNSDGLLRTSENIQTSTGHHEVEPLADECVLNSASPMEDNKYAQVEKQAVFLGFQTGSGHIVETSNKANAYARKLVQSVEQDGKLDFESNTDNGKHIKNETNLLEKQPKSNWAGFMTGSGKTVTISEKALAEARSILQSETEVNEKEIVCQPQKGDVINSADIIPSTKFSGFQTGSGICVSISKKARAEARTMLQSAEENQVSPHAMAALRHHKKEKVESASPKFQGFQTGSGKTIQVSEEALTEARNELQSRDDVIYDSVNSSKEPACGQFQGFQTGSGKSVKVSQKSLAMARHVLESAKEVATNHQTGFPVDQPKEKYLQKSTSDTKFEGFQTGSGKMVKVTDKALAKARHVLLSGEEDVSYKPSPPVKHNDQEKELPGKELQSKFQGFQTGSGKTVKISNKALAQARNMLQSTECGSSCSDSVDKKESQCTARNSDPCILGSQTSSGKTIQTSETSLVNAQNRLHSAKNETSFSKACQDNFSNNTNTTMAVQVSSNVNQSHDCSVQHEQDYKVSERIKVAQNHGMPAVDQELYLSFEALESVKALLEDGDFDEQTECTASSLIPEPCAKRLLFEPPKRQWMNSVSSTPEGALLDRENNKKTIEMRPQLTAPKKGKAINVNPQPLSYRTVNHFVNRSDDRKAFMPKQQYTTAQKRSGTRPTENSSTSNFTTPNKKSNGYHSNEGSTTSHCVADAHVSGKTSGSFNTPFKKVQAASNFHNPFAKSSPEKSEHLQVKDKAVTGEFGDEFDNLGKPVPVPEKEIGAETNPALNNPNKRPSISPEVKKKRAKSRLAQAQRIKEKRTTGGAKPVAGRLLTMRKEGAKCGMSSAVNGERPACYAPSQLFSYGARHSTLGVTACTAEDYRFLLEEHCGETVASTEEGMHVGDGAFLVFGDDSTVGKEEFCNALLELDCVEPKLISRDWVYNHYRWIVWKLAALETAFPQQFAGRALTPDIVMLQLKYRYDREIDLSQRSVLKKIYEKDDSPQKCMVLCVSAILNLPLSASVSTTSTPKAGTGKNEGTNQQPNYGVLELTDGWYNIKTAIDRPLTSLTRRGQIQVGTKLCVYGAELLGSQDGCSPLEVPPDTMLRITANCTRRARWDAQLGLCFTSHPPCLPIASLYPDGGMVGCVDVVIARLYPLQYLEKLPDGSSVFRTGRAEEKAAQKYERERQVVMERLYSSLQEEFERRNTCSGRTKQNTKQGCKGNLSLYSGPELYEAWQSAYDPDGFESQLTMTQLDLLSEYKRKALDEQQAELQSEFRTKLDEFSEKNPQRSVTPLLKVRVAGCHNRDIDSNISTILTIWRPSSDIIDSLTEGSRYLLCNVTAGENRSKRTLCPVALTATRTTRYHSLSVEDNFLDLLYEPRESSAYCDFNEGFKPLYGDVDVVGIIVKISGVSRFERTSHEDGSVQMVYLSDAEGDFIGVKFWGGIKAFFLDDLLKPGTVVGGSNLQWRYDGRARVPCVTFTDMTTISLNPKEGHLKKNMVKLKGMLKSNPGFLLDVQKQLEQRLSGQSLGYSDHRTPSRPVSNPGPYTPLNSTAIPSFTSCPRVGILPRPGALTDNYTTPIRPGSLRDPSKTDSVLERKRALQQAKALRLEMYEGMYTGDHANTDIGSLNSPIPQTVRRAFKAPALKRAVHQPVPARADSNLNGHIEATTTSFYNSDSQAKQLEISDSSELCLKSTSDDVNTVGSPEDSNPLSISSQNSSTMTEIDIAERLVSMKTDQTDHDGAETNNSSNTTLALRKCASANLDMKTVPDPERAGQFTTHEGVQVQKRGKKRKDPEALGDNSKRRRSSRLSKM